MVSLDQSLALLARYRNSLHHCNRLTPDVLVLVFEEIVAEWNNPYNENFGSYPWKGLAQVCHYWRTVALGSPILWTQINTRHQGAALACIERSAEAPLSLVISTYSTDEKVSSILQALQPHAARIRKLYLPSNYLKTSDGNIHQLVQPLISSSAPMLETLETIKVRADPGWIPMPQIFAAETPHLTRLKVHFMCPQIRSISVARLKYLSFTGRKHTPINLSVSGLLDLLEAAPSLEVLKARKVTFSAPSEDETRIIELPNLKLLELGRDLASTLADILNRLILPECAIKLMVWFDRYEDNKFYMGVPKLEELAPVHPLRGVRKMHVNYLNGYEGIEISGATSHSPFMITGYLEHTTISNLGDMDSIAGTVFQSLIRAFDFDSLEEFAITELRNNARWTGFTTKVWMDAFKRMPNLKSLYIVLDGCYDEGISRSILSALNTPDDRSNSILCPNLEDLSVWGDKTWSSLKLFKLAEKRMQVGCPLKRVSMKLAHYASFSDPLDTDLAELRQVVETVDLEPSEISFPEFPESPS